MQKFTVHEGVAVPLDAANIDTDQIIPKQFLLSVSRRGFGRHLFHDWRYLDDAETQLNPDFNLNRPEFAGASIIVARNNFGNGSSREHAPWALLDYGIRAVIAPSFASIYNHNSLNNGLLNVTLTAAEVEEIFTALRRRPGMKLRVSLVENTVTCGERVFTFKLDDFHRHCLLDGLDGIALTLRHAAEIEAYEHRRPAWSTRGTSA